MAKPKSFEAQINQWTRKCRYRVEGVFKTAVQAVAEEANIPTAQGGRMRVDTSFLRNSQVADLNQVPYGPSVNGSDPQGNPDDVALVIARANIDDVIWVGWTANYARVREYYDGFLKAAAQRWPQQVRSASAEMRRRFP